MSLNLSNYRISINCSTFRSRDGFEINNVRAENSVVLVVEVGMSQVPLGACNSTFYSSTLTALCISVKHVNKWPMFCSGVLYRLQ